MTAIRQLKCDGCGFVTSDSDEEMRFINVHISVEHETGSEDYCRSCWERMKLALSNTFVVNTSAISISR